MIITPLIITAISTFHKLITIIEILGTLKAITEGRVTATKTMTIGPPNGLIDQFLDNHQLTADGEERRRREYTPM